MRAYIKLFCIVICFLYSSSCMTSASQPSSIISEQKQKELIIERDLGKAVISWLADGNEPAAMECDKLVDSLLELDNPTARSYFIAAQVAKLLNNPQKAISALEKAIDKYPNDKAPIRIKAPTKIVGRFWIAYIAKQSGDFQQAQGVYETLLSALNGRQTIEDIEDKNALIMTCQLYLAEIESEQSQNNQKALSHLKAITEAERPIALQGYMKTGFDLRKSWATYEFSSITRGRGEANLELSPVSELMPTYILAVQHLLLNGISGEPLVGSRKGMNIVMDRLIDKTIQSKFNPIDRDLARLGYGYDQHHKGNIEKAGEYFSSLFQDESFFSPVAGVSLARVKKTQNKNDEANDVLDQVSKKYPDYGSVVKQVRQSWK